MSQHLRKKFSKEKAIIIMKGKFIIIQTLRGAILFQLRGALSSLMINRNKGDQYI